MWSDKHYGSMIYQQLESGLGITKSPRHNHIMPFFGTCSAEYMQYLHVKNAVEHKDIKPENILIDSHGYVSLAGFGISKQYQSETELTRGGPALYSSITWNQRRLRHVQIWDNNCANGCTATACTLCNPLHPQFEHLEMIESTMSSNPNERPSITELSEDFMVFSQDYTKCKDRVRFGPHKLKIRPATHNVDVAKDSRRV